MKAHENKLHIHMHHIKKTFHFNTNSFGCIGSFPEYFYRGTNNSTELLKNFV